MVLRRISGETVLLSLWKKLDSTAFSSHCMGQFYLDFLDKVITIVLVFSLIKLVQKKIVSNRQHTLLMMFLCILALGVIRGETVTAKTVTEQEDYSSYLQTVYGRENGIPVDVPMILCRRRMAFYGLEHMAGCTGIMAQNFNGSMNMNR